MKYDSISLHRKEKEISETEELAAIVQYNMLMRNFYWHQIQINEMSRNYC